MKDEMEHERMRFRTMNPNQLITRLNRITKEDKLRRYMIVAQQVGYIKLAEMAERKLYQMRGEVIVNKQPVIKQPTMAEEIVSVVQEIFTLRPARKFSFD